MNKSVHNNERQRNGADWGKNDWNGKEKRNGLLRTFKALSGINGTNGVK